MNSQTVTLTLYDYLLGVLAAEMPASFPLEALKAQAVAARTFTLSRMEAADSGNGTDGDADVCTDPSHCKAYTDWTSVVSKWESIGRRDYGEKMIQASQARTAK
jgi:stage II sporulation protein D